MALVDSVVVFVVSALVGGLGIYVGARVVVGKGDYGHAVVTALVGALVWFVVSALFGWVPLLGPALVLLAYLLVIRSRYRAGWLEAGGIALVAWLAAVVVLAVLRLAGVVPGDVLGIPFV